MTLEPFLIPVILRLASRLVVLGPWHFTEEAHSMALEGNPYESFRLNAAHFVSFSISSA